jgi:hypothetical protein
MNAVLEFDTHPYNNATSGPRHDEVIGLYRGEPLYHASLAAQEYRTLAAIKRLSRCGAYR